jgi:hypothetical protein
MDPPQGPHKIAAASDLRNLRGASQRRSPDDPPGTKWHKADTKSSKGPQERMFEHADLHNHKFMVACDCPTFRGNPAKMYASYPSTEDFVSNTLLKTEARNCYELIREGKSCKFYLDVEWIGPEDLNKEVIHHVVEKLKAYFKVRSVHTSLNRNLSLKHCK